jgi:hypothetical protein
MQFISKGFNTFGFSLSGITIDCTALLFGLQHKSPHRAVVRILQREKETFQTVIRLPSVVLAPDRPVPYS